LYIALKIRRKGTGFYLFDKMNGCVFVGTAIFRKFSFAKRAIIVQKES
jgi:hypothetical protein